MYACTQLTISCNLIDNRKNIRMSNGISVDKLFCGTFKRLLSEMIFFTWAFHAQWTPFKKPGVGVLDSFLNQTVWINEISPELTSVKLAEPLNKGVFFTFFARLPQFYDYFGHFLGEEAEQRISSAKLLFPKV